MEGGWVGEPRPGWGRKSSVPGSLGLECARREGQRTAETGDLGKGARPGQSQGGQGRKEGVRLSFLLSSFHLCLLPSACPSPPFSRRVAVGAGSQEEGLSSPEKWRGMKQCVKKHFLVFISHPKCFLTSDPTLRNSPWSRRKAGHRRSWRRAPRSAVGQRAQMLGEDAGLGLELPVPTPSGAGHHNLRSTCSISLKSPC